MSITEFLGHHPLLSLLWSQPARRLVDPDYQISWGGARVESHSQIFKSQYFCYPDPQRRARARREAVLEVRGAIAEAFLLGIPKTVTSGGSVTRYTAGLLYLTEHLPRIPKDRWRLAVLRPLTHTVVTNPLAALETAHFLAEVGLYVLSENEEPQVGPKRRRMVDRPQA